LIWDMVPFFNELEILELRLETLDPVVDKFVICEATTTHSGKPKPLLLQENGHRFARWAHKIKHVVVELGQTTDWGREKEQRVCLWHGFSGHPSDLIILSDVDEIPNPEAVGAAEEIMSGFYRSCDPHDGNILLCRMHVGKLNWRWKTPAHESHSICRIFPAQLIGTKYANLEEARLAHMEPLGPPGWHLSWMSEPEKKLASFVHQELVPYADIKGALEGKPLFPGVIHEEIEWCNIDELPPVVRENPERFAHMMVEQPAHV
jgi:hypothetical protein